MHLMLKRQAGENGMDIIHKQINYLSRKEAIWKEGRLSETALSFLVWNPG